MNTTITLNDQRRVAERRAIPTRRNTSDRRRSAELIDRAWEGAGKHDHALDLLGCVIAIVISVAVLVLTGLLEGAQSIGVQIMLIAGVVYSFVVAFRRAFYS